MKHHVNILVLSSYNETIHSFLQVYEPIVDTCYSNFSSQQYDLHFITCSSNESIQKILDSHFIHIVYLLFDDPQLYVTLPIFEQLLQNKITFLIRINTSYEQQPSNMNASFITKTFVCNQKRKHTYKSIYSHTIQVCENIIFPTIQQVELLQQNNNDTSLVVYTPTTNTHATTNEYPADRLERIEQKLDYILRLLMSNLQLKDSK